RSHFFHAVGNARAFEHEGNGSLADLTIRGVLAPKQRVDHGIFEMGPAPPGDESIWITLPPFAREKGTDNLHQTGLHVHHRAVLVEHADRDGLFDIVKFTHGALLAPMLFPS